MIDAGKARIGRIKLDELAEKRGERFETRLCAVASSESIQRSLCEIL